VAARPITFLSDYGHDDEFVGVCRAVIARIAPGTSVVDLTHGIRRHAVADGAAVLARALPYTAPGVHLAVVDPGVGSERRGVAVLTGEDDRILVGPDNGLLSPAAERLGGTAAAVDISLSPLRLEPISATFHGRDLFAPVAAHLALGAALGDAGEEIEPSSLVSLPATGPRLEGATVVAHVVLVDRYGNAALDLEHERLAKTGLRLGRPVRVQVPGSVREAPFVLTFSDAEPGELVVYEDSYRALALAVNRGSAAAELDLQPGSEVVLSPA